LIAQPFKNVTRFSRFPSSPPHRFGSPHQRVSASDSVQLSCGFFLPPLLLSLPSSDLGTPGLSLLLPETCPALNRRPCRLEPTRPPSPRVSPTPSLCLFRPVPLPLLAQKPLRPEGASSYPFPQKIPRFLAFVLMDNPPDPDFFRLPCFLFFSIDPSPPCALRIAAPR